MEIPENQMVNDTEALVVINIFNEKVHIKLDTGAEVNVMPIRVYHKLMTDKRVPKDGEIKTTNTN